MDIAQYEKRRNEIVGYIDMALTLPHIYDSTRESLEEIRRKVFENQFRIVLIARFEGGKSTTLNALCGGMEISPRGALIRTSATVISAQNTTDSKLIGKAEIFWRSDRELAMVFARCILQSIRTLCGERFAKVNQSEQLASMLRFPDDIPLIQRAVRQRLEEIRKMSNPPLTDNEALRMAWLICEFYGSEELEKLRQQANFTAEEIGRMVCFPERWSFPWLDSGKVPFTVEDCLFLFIKEARVYIKSERLRRTGSEIIDCPGLFASKYDSKVAFDILENADAVWYILPEQQLGEEDVEFTKALLTAKPGKVFFTINVRQNTKANLQNIIIPNHINDLKRLGVSVDPDDIMVYNAQLALIASQAEKVLAGTLDSHSEEAIRRLSDKFNQNGSDSLEDILGDWAENGLRNAYSYTGRQLRGFDLFDGSHSGIELLDRECGFDSIISKIEQAVIQQKAESVLIETGSKKVVALLEQVEADLKVSEDLATQNETAMLEEFEAARRKLDLFQTFCEQELLALEDEQLDKLLAEDYWKKVIVSSINEVASKAAEKIADMNCNEVRQEESEQIVNDVFADVVMPKATAWVNGIKQGENPIFNSLIMSRVHRIQWSTEQKWALTVKEQPLLNGLPVPTPIIGTDAISFEFIDSVVAKTPGIAKEVMTGAAAGAAMGACIGSFVFPFIGGVAGGIIGGVLGLFVGGGAGHDNRKRQIQEAISAELTKNFGQNGDGQESILRKQERRVRMLRIGIINAFKEAFNNTASAFRTRQAEAELLYKEQMEQRKILAEKNRIVRTMQIAPLREEVQKFEQEVKAECV